MRGKHTRGVWPNELEPQVVAQYIYNFIKPSLDSIVNAVSENPFLLRVNLMFRKCFVVQIYIFIRFFL